MPVPQIVLLACGGEGLFRPSLAAGGSATQQTGGRHVFSLMNPVFSMPGMPPIRGIVLTRWVFEGHIKPRHAFDTGAVGAGRFSRGILNQGTSVEDFSAFLEQSINTGVVSIQPYGASGIGIRLFVDAAVPFGTGISGAPSTTLVIGLAPAGTPGSYAIITAFPFGD